MTIAKETRERIEQLRRAEWLTTRREEDLRMLTTPDKWPCWPLLPMKRSQSAGHGMPDVACVTESYGDESPVKYRLYEHCIMFMFPKNERGEAAAPLLLMAEEILDRGWTVD